VPSFKDIIALYFAFEERAAKDQLFSLIVPTDLQQFDLRKFLETRVNQRSTFTWKPTVLPQAVFNNLDFLESVIIQLLQKEGHPDAQGFVDHCREFASRTRYGLTMRQLFAATSVSPNFSFRDEPLPPHGAGAGRWGPPPRRGTPEFSAFPLVQYNALVHVACNVVPIGNWSIVLGDLLGNVYGDLNSKKLTSLVKDHPGTSISALSDTDLQILVARFVDMRDSLRAKEESSREAGLGSAIGKALKWLWENSDKIIFFYEAYENAMERARQADEERKRAEEEKRKADEAAAAAAAAKARQEADEQLERLARGEGISALEHAEDHVDAFERNRDFIERTC
jgi:hypothetical protein